MGSKNKLKRFLENETFSNVIQPSRKEVSDGFHLKGKWNAFFKNDNPIILELGCGKGEYTIALARKNPHYNYIGVDIKGARFWRGAKTALEDNLTNVAFLRTQIELIDLCFAINEISEIWITFPDPQIKFKRMKHRLTNPEFLKKYQQILIDKGVVHLKTDSEFLHGYTLGLLQEGKHEIIYAHHHIYKNNHSPEEATLTKTFYEKQFLEQNKAITYIKFRTHYK
ncbi:MAG TPA: tRNA (guanosine(46)-N7)-methyltransferase TrmB [Flavobacteriaceae bacterium]|nr:tRNA (guanosine(46)-N7)-methyltransferase TrmB [Flavobacteriaceae bacterium]HBS12754.1 tRNA (guanosine(46)-N7)-methyltransferase TrmB [Flavobacteriaceae bacterium]